MLTSYSMNRIRNIIKGISYFLALPFLSGILVGTSYIPFNGWALFFCYLPLWFKVIQLTDDNKKFSQIFASNKILSCAFARRTSQFASIFFDFSNSEV